MVRRALLLLSTLAPLAASHAQDAVDIGVIKESEVQVVQKLLYPKTGKTESGLHLGFMPFDFATKTPNAEASVQVHMDERWSFGARLGAGWGLKSKKYRELEGPDYGVAYYAYRYLGSALAGIEYAPIYGKASVDHKRIVHHDLYGALRAGATLESSLIPTGDLSRISVAPTVSVGVGSRIFLSPKSAIRIELRDDVLLQPRSLTGRLYLKQNVNLTAGFTLLGGGGS